MALPKKLKNFNLFVNGLSYAGLVPELTLPKLTRKTEDYQAGGMQGPVKAHLGMDAMEMQWNMAGFDRDTLAQWGITTVGGVLLRFAGALQQDDTGAITSIEIVTRGYHTEMDPGNAKAGDKTEVKITSALSYYKVSMNNIPVIEIDLVNMVNIVNGEDLAALERLAIGL